MLDRHRPDHLIGADAEGRVARHADVHVLAADPVIVPEPLHHVVAGVVDRVLHGQVDAHRDDAVRLLDAHTGGVLVLDHRGAQLDRRPRLVGDAGELGVPLPAVYVADIEQAAVVIGVEIDRVPGAHVAAVDVAAEGALAQQRGEDLPLRRARQRAAEGHQVPGQLVGIAPGAVPRVAARAGKVLDHLHMRLRTLGPALRIAERADARQDAREAVAPGVDGIDMDRQRVAPRAALDMDRTHHGVVFGRPDALQRHHMLAGEVVHLGIVAVVGDEA